MALELFWYCEKNSKLYLRQIGRWKKRSTIDVVATLIHTIQKKFEEKKRAAALLMDITVAFDHFLKRQSLTQMIKLGVYCDYMN